MEIVVIDGQGGGLGKAVIEAIKQKNSQVKIIGVATNALATAALKKGGADIIATGENAICYNARNASIIIGPIGLIVPNAMYGEVSMQMSQAIASSDAVKYLIPISKCTVKIAGTKNISVSEYIDDIIQKLDI